MEHRGFKHFDEFEETDELNQDLQRTADLERDGATILYREKKPKRSFLFYFRIFIIALTIMGLVYCFGNLVLLEFRHVMEKFTKYMKENPYKGISLYVIFFIIGQQIFIPPGTFITFTTNTFMTIFGNYEGILVHFVIIYFSEHFAMILTYFIGKHMCGIGKILSKKIQYFDIFNALVVKKGAKITFLLRVCLILPYDVINYILSTTDIGLWDYFIGNHGFFIDFIVSTYIGISISNISGIGKTHAANIYQQIMLLIISLIIVFGVTCYIVKLAKKEFDGMIKAENNKKRMFNNPKLS